MILAEYWLNGWAFIFHSSGFDIIFFFSFVSLISNVFVAIAFIAVTFSIRCDFYSLLIKLTATSHKCVFIVVISLLPAQGIQWCAATQEHLTHHHDNVIVILNYNSAYFITHFCTIITIMNLPTTQKRRRTLRFFLCSIRF